MTLQLHSGDQTKRGLAWRRGRGRGSGDIGCVQGGQVCPYGRQGGGKFGGLYGVCREYPEQVGAIMWNGQSEWGGSRSRLFGRQLLIPPLYVDSPGRDGRAPQLLRSVPLSPNLDLDELASASPICAAASSSAFSSKYMCHRYGMFLSREGCQTLQILTPRIG
ncbi:hypothetical protein GYMLUDRAFT_561843 [Collybiopsis luxurians FD-317 M1]|uniref:Uncharacterized protein n=1 Tax=Collybiopsis luxurians FD-317 M1 TaxID=944289 RepID=A0A0D0C1R7_9AGAR|nr:hypothetical protein GYMLUDRAFT_561843 [Collybiopsis luxurians FD-317 M1]